MSEAKAPKKKAEGGGGGAGKPPDKKAEAKAAKASRSLVSIPVGAAVPKDQLEKTITVQPYRRVVARLPARYTRT